MMRIHLFSLLLWFGAASRDDEATGEVASVSSDDVWIDVVFENDTPQPMERVSIVHKFNGVTPKTQVMVWDNVGAWETTAPQRVKTAVGFWPGHYDWWVTSWRYKRVPGEWARSKAIRDMGCQSCVKEDGTCETWTTSGGSFFMAFFTDPMTYIKGAMAAANIIVGALSLGTSAVFGTALAGLVTEGVAGTYLADDKTDGFYSCGLSEQDYLNSQKGMPVRLRAWRTAGRSHAVQIESFEPGTAADVAGGVERVPWSNEDGPQPPLEYRNDGSTVLVSISSSLVFASVTSGKVIRRLKKGERVTVSGKPRDDGKGHVMVPIKPNGAVQLNHFDVWKPRNPEWCQSWHNKPLPCYSSGTVKQGTEVSLRIHNDGLKNIKRLVVVHKHNGLKPAVRIRQFNDIAPQASSKTQSVQTMTGFGFRSDWWLTAWQEEGRECVVKTTLSGGFFEKLLSNPAEPLVHVAGNVLETLLHTDFIEDAIDAAFHIGEHMGDELGGLTNSSMEDILGLSMVHLLAKNTDTDALLKCSLGARDAVNSKAGQPVEIHINGKMNPDDGVFVKTAAKSCAAKVVWTRCLQTEACAQTEACRLLNNGAAEFEEYADELGKEGAMMGLQKAIRATIEAI